MGYHRAGFDVVGVDKDPQPHYPFEFIQADAIEFVREHGLKFDAVHASPPCQVHSKTAVTHNVSHPDLIEPTRDALREVGRPYVIENVEGAPLIDPLVLCGSEFGLRANDVDGVSLALRVRAALLGIDWRMNEHELNQAIPPAYTQHIGTQLIAHLKELAA